MKTYRMTVEIEMYAFDYEDAIQTIAFIKDDLKDATDIQSFLLRDIQELTDKEI